MKLSYIGRYSNQVLCQPNDVSWAGWCSPFCCRPWVCCTVAQSSASASWSSWWCSGNYWKAITFACLSVAEYCWSSLEWTAYQSFVPLWLFTTHLNKSPASCWCLIFSSVPSGPSPNLQLAFAWSFRLLAGVRVSSPRKKFISRAIVGYRTESVCQPCSVSPPIEVYCPTFFIFGRTPPDTACFVPGVLFAYACWRGISWLFAAGPGSPWPCPLIRSPSFGPWTRE